MPYTETAAETTRGAKLPHFFASILPGTLNPNPLSKGHQLNNVLGTDGYARAAADAQVFGHMGDSVFHMDRVKLTDLRTGSKTETAICTGFRPVSGNDDRLQAARDAVVTHFFPGHAAFAAALDISDLLHEDAGPYAEDSGDVRGYRRAAYGAGGWGGGTVRYRPGVGIASRVAAAAAIRAGQRLANLFKFRIRLYGEFLGRKANGEAKNEPQTG